MNLKALPEDFKIDIRNKFEEEFFPWLEENWELCTGVAEAGVSYDKWRDSEYGIARFEGLLNFMDADDWSVRLPEMAEWCYTVAEQRNLNFNEIYPEMDWLEWYDKRS